MTLVPDSIQASGEKAEHDRLRFEVYHRLKAANLEVACLRSKDLSQVLSATT
jgi:hypothetical protein